MWWAYMFLASYLCVLTVQTSFDNCFPCFRSKDRCRQARQQDTDLGPPRAEYNYRSETEGEIGPGTSGYGPKSAHTSPQRPETPKVFYTKKRTPEEQRAKEQQRPKYRGGIGNADDYGRGWARKERAPRAEFKGYAPGNPQDDGRGWAAYSREQEEAAERGEEN